MEKDGSVPVPFQSGASSRAVVAFCEVGVPPPHLTPATDSCEILSGSFSASQCTAGQYSLHFSQKNLKYLARGICMIHRRRDRGLPCLPSEQSPSTHSHPVMAGLVGQGTISTPAKM